MTEQLKPCPFCGGRGVINLSADLPFVYCEKCDANGPECDSKLAAVQWWNTRTAEPQWQPIETAPMDDAVDILVYSPEGVEIAWWSDGNNCWLNRDGKYTFGDPTHWKPLPPPPEGETK